MGSDNYGLCEHCRNPVPVEHVIKDGSVFLRKDCPDCGPNQSLVSSNAERWQQKRDLWRMDPEANLACGLRCQECSIEHHPPMVFLDVTNRCNMNCPICINNTPSMGFVFNPPLRYFERIFDHLAEMDPKPVVQLFGGEPTVRNDMFDIVEMGRERGLKLRVVTNGLKLADEEYCQKVCEADLPVLLGFDGNSREIYDNLRKNPSAFPKKVQAFENLSKYSRRKNTIMCCVGRGINDGHMNELVGMCHEHRHAFKCLHLIPLTETWDEGEFEAEVSTTTTEDVEDIMDESIPEGDVEFIPAGMARHLNTVFEFLGTSPPRFGNVHPNCESVTYLLSDGESYRPVEQYLHGSMEGAVDRVAERAGKIEPVLSSLDPERWLQRQVGRVVIAAAFLGLLLGLLDFKALCKRNPAMTALSIFGGLLSGRRLKDQLRSCLVVESGLLMIVLPFEEYHSVESARMQNCRAGFAFENPDTGDIETIPVCLWGEYKNDLQRRIMDSYSDEQSAAVPEMEAKRAGNDIPT